MSQNRQIATDVLKAVGGKDNVTSVVHCMTRLRFTLKNNSIPNDSEVKKIPGVLGLVKQGGQYQVIVGQTVPGVYAELCTMGSFKTDSSGSQKAASSSPVSDKKIGMVEYIGNAFGSVKEYVSDFTFKGFLNDLKNIFANVMDYMSGSFTPLIPVLIAGALFRTVTILFGADMLDVLPADSDIVLMCDMMYESVFYFLPVFLGYSAAKKIGASPVLGMMIGTSLIVPDFRALIDVEETIDIWGIFSAPVASYSQTVLPILIAVFFLYYVERFFKYIVPEIISMVFAPFFTMAVMVVVTFVFAAPVGGWISEILGDALFSFANNGGFIAIAIVAALYQFLVLFGMHHVIGMLAITVMLEQGVEYAVRPAGAIANFACFGMAIGAFLKMKNKKEKSLALGYSVTGLLGGVSEPTLFGIGVRFKRPLIAMAIGGFAGGLYAGITHVGAYQFASPGFLGVLAFANGGTANFINGTIACFGAMFVSAAATYILVNFEDANGQPVA